MNVTIEQVVCQFFTFILLGIIDVHTTCLPRDFFG